MLSRAKRVISKRRARKSRGDEGDYLRSFRVAVTVPSVFSGAQYYAVVYHVYIFKRDYTEGYLWPFASISVSLSKLNVK